VGSLAEPVLLLQKYNEGDKLSAAAQILMANSITFALTKPLCSAYLRNEPNICGPVRPAKAGVFSGSQSLQGKSQSPVTWIASVEETELMKPIDKAIFWMVSESPGHSVSEPSDGLENIRSGGRVTWSGAKAAWSGAD
jgi:hypothetical protein